MSSKVVSPTETPRRRRAAPASERPYERDRAQILRRLARLEGQVRGVARMIERDEACLDVLQQTAALRAAVDSVAMLLMEDHVHGCLERAVASGDSEIVADEVIEVLRRSLGRPARQARATSEP
jgi:DNA-binding FrmR family transcriptional regulator